MSQHVYARLAGFGLIVVPRAPYRIQQAAEPSGLLNIEHYSGEGGPLNVQLTPSHGGWGSKLSGNASLLSDLVDVEAGPALDAWRIETTLFSCSWPTGYSLCSNNFPNDPAPFELIGPRGELMYVQNPRHMPDVADMRADYQAVVSIERCAAWDAIDLEYEHQGGRWRQRHIVVSLADQRIAVTMQSPAEFATEAKKTANNLATNLAPFE